MLVKCRIAGVLFGAVLVLACAEEKVPTRPETSEELSVVPQEGVLVPWTIDHEYDRIAKEEVPGFGGFYFDDDHNPVVWLVDTTQRAAAEQFVTGFLARRGESMSRVTIRQANYDFPTLKQWRDDLRPFLAGREGALTLDIDETINKLRIGVVDAATVEVFRQEILALGIPASALLIEVQPRIVPLKLLVDSVRPVKPGFQIVAKGSEGRCTLGYNALWHNPYGERVFVTNSHCSKKLYELDYGLVGQNDSVPGKFVGEEFYDRAPYQNCDGEHPGYTCRMSDATLYEYHDTVDVQFGYMTRTEYYGRGQDGSRVVDSQKPTFTITDESEPDEPVAGDWVNKVGRTTGWTRGLILQTCADCFCEDFYETKQLVCQDVATLWAGLGDSGSPVFVAGGLEMEFQESIGWYAEASGIVWGGVCTYNPSYGAIRCPVSYYSHIYNVQYDLGNLFISEFPH